MTARDRIFRRAMLGIGYMIAFFVVVAVVMETSPARPLSLGVAASLALLFAVPYALLVTRAKCPRCDYPFVFIGFARLKTGARRRRIDFCPHCRLALDTPVADVVRRD